MSCTDLPPRNTKDFYKPQDKAKSAFPVTNDNFTTAGPDPNMSAKNFCKQSQEKSESLASTIMGGIASMTPMGAISKLAGNLGAKAEATTEINNNINNTISNTNRSLVNQTCDNAMAIDQYNVSDRTKCLKAAKCDDIESLLKYSNRYNNEVIQDALKTRESICNNITNAKVTQLNKLNARQNCTLNNITKILTDVSLNTTLAAVLDQSLKSSGVLTKTSTNTKMCNSINNNISAQSYAEAYQTCANQLNLTQCNAADCGAIDQSNIADLFQACLQTNGVTMASSSGSGTGLTTKIKQVLTADTSTMFIVILIILLLIGGVFLKMKMKKKGG